MLTTAWLAGKGFDIERLRFGLRTALASCLALVVAWSLGLEHPQWSAMTVWAASQPVRELMVEKSLYRMAGTLVGTAVGLLLLMVAGDSLPWLVIGLALWVGLCAGAGNALYSLLSYGALLSGYSAAMVALLGSADSLGTLALGADRLLTVLVGVVMALLVGLLFTPGARRSELEEQGRRCTTRVLHQLAAQLGSRRHPGAQAPSDLLVDIALLEAQLEPSAAGSRRARHSARTQRTILAALTAALLWMRRSGQAALTLGEALQALQHYGEQADAATRRRLAASLRRLGRLRQSPLEAAAALERLARTLARRQQVALARQSRHAARLLRANQAFFQQAS